MTRHGIPLDEAELLSVLLEGILYGFSLLMFGATICILWVRRSTHRVNRSMLTIACLLLLFSTVHLVIDIIRIVEGLVLFRDTCPGGPNGYFADVSQWTFVYKTYVYTAQTLTGDGVILYRCYIVWRSKLIMILPALLWCAVAVTGIGSPFTASHAIQHEVFYGSLSRWMTSFFVSTLTANLLATFLLAYRIWSVDRAAAMLCVHRKSQLRHILHVIVDAGVIYSVTLCAALICFIKESNGQYVIIDMVTPIISITFYMIIIRVGLANQPSWPGTILTTEVCVYLPQSQSLSTDRRSGVQVHTTTLTETRVENDQHLPMDPKTLCSENIHLSENKSDGIGEET